MEKMATLMRESEGQQSVSHYFLGMSCIESATVFADKNSDFVSETSLGGGACYGRPEPHVSVTVGASTGVTPASSDLGSGELKRLEF